VLRRVLALALAAGFPALAQQKPAPPPVRVNVINVCTPSAEDQKEIAAALGRIPRQPLFAADFEISRGRSSLTEKPGFLQAGETAQFSGETSTATWVRIRREFSVQALFSNVQYSFSRESRNMMEILVLRVRDPKELMQVSIEDSVASVTTPAALLATNTPVTRIKLERFGKSSVVLARCASSEGGPPPDQSAYEPLFRTASSLLAAYRDALDVRRTVPAELARITAPAGAVPKKPAAAGKPQKK